MQIISHLDINCTLFLQNVISRSKKTSITARPIFPLPEYPYSLIFPIILPPTPTVLFCYYRMYCGLWNSKLFRRLPHRGIVLNNIIGNVHRTLFDIIFQKETPQNTFLHCMKWFEGLWRFSKLNILLSHWSQIFPHYVRYFLRSFQPTSIVHIRSSKKPLTAPLSFDKLTTRHNILNSKHCLYVFIPIYASEYQ